MRHLCLLGLLPLLALTLPSCGEIDTVGPGAPAPGAAEMGAARVSRAGISAQRIAPRRGQRGPAGMERSLRVRPVSVVRGSWPAPLTALRSSRATPRARS